MYKEIEQLAREEKALLIKGFEELDAGKITVKTVSVGVDRAFTVRAEQDNSGIFRECSTECRKNNGDHDSDICALRRLYLYLVNFESYRLKVGA